MDATPYEALSVPLAVTTRALSAADDVLADGDAEGDAEGDTDGPGAFGEADGDALPAGDAARGVFPADRWCMTAWPRGILTTPVCTSFLAAIAGGARSGFGAWCPGTRSFVLVADAGT